MNIESIFKKKVRGRVWSMVKVQPQYKPGEEQ